MNNLPKHIGFIMDGNGRWAKKRGLPRSLGHKEGVNALERVCDYCFSIGINNISLYAFSTENFKRDKDEVNYIFNLLKEYLQKKESRIIENKIKINIMGDYLNSAIPDDVKTLIKNIVEKTASFDKILNIGLAYGGRAEIVGAVNKIIKEKKQFVSEAEFSNYLYTAGQPDPDLIVRASGEERISNFMLYQIAYSEFYFPKTLWPDFDKNEVDKAIIAYQSRDRRFGGVKNK